ncbi:MAG: hypothetical protein AB7G47_22210 [Mycolicibacterium sp.]|uniref:hypothetical protein n=1 Tax=Mycolicibacterium sp. TaxID=2320850 RepID=UPI003D11D4C8
MNTTDNPTTWHDLRDELTPQQIAYIQDFEDRYPETLAGGADRANVMLRCAIDHAKQNRHDREHFGHLPVPDAPIRMSAWEPADDDNTLGPWLRTYDLRDWIIDLPGEPPRASRADLTLAGAQLDDGRIERWVIVEANSVRMTSAKARELAAALLAAADELDQLDGRHPADSTTRKCCGGIGAHTQDCR